MFILGEGQEELEWERFPVRLGWTGVSGVELEQPRQSPTPRSGLCCLLAQGLCFKQEDFLSGPPPGISGCLVPWPHQVHRTLRVVVCFPWVSSAHT